MLTRSQQWQYHVSLSENFNYRKAAEFIQVMTTKYIPVT